MPSIRQLITALIACPLLTSAVPARRHRADRCHKGAYIIIAHGSNEHGKGALGQISSQIAPQIPDSWTVPIKYPSSLNNYSWSEGTGVHKMKERIKDYVDKCGHQAQIILLGYSQGANVITDTLGGGSFAGEGKHGNQYSLPLDPKYGNHIKTILLYGDPSWTVNQPYDAGTSKSSGLIGRSAAQLQELDNYKDRMISYCDALDPYCASAPNDPQGLAVHDAYFSNYDSQAIPWILKTWTRVVDKKKKGD